MLEAKQGLTDGGSHASCRHKVKNAFWNFAECSYSKIWIDAPFTHASWQKEKPSQRIQFS